MTNQRETRKYFYFLFRVLKRVIKSLEFEFFRIAYIIQCGQDKRGPESYYTWYLNRALERDDVISREVTW